MESEEYLRLCAELAELATSLALAGSVTESEQQDQAIEHLDATLWALCRAYLANGPDRHRQLCRLLVNITRDLDLAPPTGGPDERAR